MSESAMTTQGETEPEPELVFEAHHVARINGVYQTPEQAYEAVSEEYSNLGRPIMGVIWGSKVYLTNFPRRADMVFDGCPTLAGIKKHFARRLGTVRVYKPPDGRCLAEEIPRADQGETPAPNGSHCRYAGFSGGKWSWCRARGGDGVLCIKYRVEFEPDDPPAQ